MDQEANAGGIAPEKVEDQTRNLQDAGIESRERLEKADTVDKANEDQSEKQEDAKADEPRRKLTGAERQKRRAERLAVELSQAQRELEALRQKNSEKPTGEFFEDPNAHVASAVRDTLRQEREAELVSKQETLRREALREMGDEYAENVDRVRERIPDFDDVVQKVSSFQLPQELAEEILSVGEKAPLISYYLAQNPSKLIELANMSGKALAREVGRIEARVHLPSAKKQTDASPPPTQVKGGAAPEYDPFKSDDMDAYIKWRSGGGGR